MSEGNNFPSFGESECQANEAASEHVAQLINEVAPGSMVTRFVLLVEMIDGEDRWLGAYTSLGQKSWDTMGMLQWGMTMEQHELLSFDDDEEQD